MSLGISTDASGSWCHHKQEDAWRHQSGSTVAPDESPAASQLFLVERHSAQALRRFVVSALDEWNLLCIAHVALSLTSELTADALLHARTGYRVTARYREGRFLRVEVLGDNARLPFPVASATDRINGRSLKVVRALASSWGVVDRPSGRVVWFELLVPARSADIGTTIGKAAERGSGAARVA